MIRKLLLVTVALSACGDPKLKVGINAGPAGADIGYMAASEIRQSRVAKDRRFEIRIAAQRAVTSNTITPEMMSAALDSLAKDEKVAYVISRFLTQEMLVAARRYNAANVPFLSVSPLPPGIAGNGNAFSLVPGLDKQAQFLASRALPSDRIAVVHIDDAHGLTLATALVTALQARGIVPAKIRKYVQSWDEPRMVALGTELEKQDDPTLVYFIGRAPSLELVWQPFREAAKNIRVIASDLVESTALYANTEGRFTGLLYVRYLDPKASDERMKDLHDRFDWWVSRGDMTGEVVMVYDALMMAAEAMKAGARTRDDFRAYFRSLGRTRPAFNGVGGPIAFGDDGEAARPFELAEVTTMGVVAAAN